MNYLQFDAYYNECKENGLTKIEPVIEVDPDVDQAYVVKTKETYIFWCDGADLEDDVERAANEFIDTKHAESPAGRPFKSELKPKAGKENKAGEVTKQACYTVVITREHN